ncbi:MAG: sigma-70 family RNA polymerase sigma factor [Parafilimonas terrae]|nr:sigma-70 family RNA polymerase sigma factor [Parafilimonas terrae]
MMPAPLSDENRDLAGTYFPLAKALARPFKARFPHLAEDLDSAACLALTLAAGAYDPARSIRFATYARFRIKGALVRVLDDARIPFDAEDGPAPHIFAAAELDDVAARESFEPDSAAALEAFDYWLIPLTIRQANVMRGLYLHDRTHAELAESMGVHRTEVTRLHNQALDRLSGRQSLPAAARQMRARKRQAPPPLIAVAG